MALSPRFIPVFAVTMSAVAVFFGTGLHPQWWATWLAPVPVLWLSQRVTARVAFAATVLSWSLGTLNTAHFFLRVIRTPLPVFMAFDILPGCVVAAAVLFYRNRMQKEWPWRASLGFAAICVAFEFIQSLVSIHGTFGSLAYTQMDFLPILQVASITGIWGITFLLLWIPAALAMQRRIPAFTAATVFVVAVGCGLLRLQFTPPPQSSLVVGLASTDLPQNIFPETAAGTDRLLGEYADMAGRLGAHGAQLVVFPEKLGVVTATRIASIDAMFEAMASAHQIEILVGLTRRTPDALLNEARLYSPEGRVEETYEKHHMLPPFESGMLVGTSRTLLRKPSGIWGVTICKDMDFPLLSRQYGNDGVGVLLVPAWDFVADGWSHGRMALLRGVESGFSIVRAAKQGILTVSDDRGRVLAQQVTGGAPFASLLTTVPIRHDATWYDRFGDWFGWFTLTLALILIADESLLRSARWLRPAFRRERQDENATAPQHR